MRFKLIIFLLLPIACFGRKFYFSASGNDSFSSTQAQNPATPWRTLTKLQSFSGSMLAQDSFLFKRGDAFADSITLFNKNNLYFGDYGTGQKPLFWGKGGIVEELFDLFNFDNCKFENLRITDTTIDKFDLQVQANIQKAMVFAQGSFFNCVSNCDFDRLGTAVYFTNTARFDTVRNCEVSYLKMIKNTPVIINPDDDYGGVPVQIGGSGCVITKNFFHHCIALSYDYGYDGGAVEFFDEGDTIQNNIISYNTLHKNNGSFEHGSLQGNNRKPIQNNLIYYNKIINCSSVFYYNNLGQYKSIMRNEQYFNNIIVQDTISPTGNLIIGSMATSEAVNNIVTFKNNIFYITNGASIMRSGFFNGGQLVHTNNIYYQSGGGGLNFTADATERTGIKNYWIDTTNTNSLYWDYNINNTSFPYQNGVNVGLGTDFAGNAVGNTPSIGAFEFVNIPPPVITDKIFIRKRFKNKINP
jgi:hypothetical protein